MDALHSAKKNMKTGNKPNGEVMIDFETFKSLYLDAKKYDNVNVYIMERGWKNWMNDIGDSTAIANLLRDIYHMSHDGFKAIKDSFKTMRQLSSTLCIPYSTVQKWAAGTNNPQEYLLLLLAYATLSISHTKQ